MIKGVFCYLYIIEGIPLSTHLVLHKNCSYNTCMSLASDYMLNFASYIQQIKEFVCFITVESNKSKDKESNSIQNGDQQSVSGGNASSQATVQRDDQSKLNIH